MTIDPEPSAQSEDSLVANGLLMLRPPRLLTRLIPCRVRFGLLLAVLLTGTGPVSPVHAQSSDAPASPLIIHVDGLESNKGSVRAELTTDAHYDSDGNVRAAVLPIEDREAHWTVDDLPPGTYAVRLYHDEDDDGELDTNMFGVPQEPFGFSNNARGNMGPPDFEDAAFTLGSDSLSMTITAE